MTGRMTEITTGTCLYPSPVCTSWEHGSRSCVPPLVQVGLPTVAPEIEKRDGFLWLAEPTPTAEEAARNSGESVLPTPGGSGWTKLPVWPAREG